MFPFPSRWACEQVSGTRIERQRNTQPLSRALALPHPKDARSCQGEPHDMIEKRPVFMPSYRGSRRVLRHQNLLQIRQLETGRGLNFPASFHQKIGDGLMGSAFCSSKS